MLPLRDENSKGPFPWLVLLLLLLNIGLFAYQVTLRGPEASAWISSLAAQPRRLVQWRAWGQGGIGSLPPLTLISSLFLHGSLLHLLGNMLFLWIFGDNIERAFGRLRFFLFYLLCGVLATLTHVLYHPASAIPLIGASGAISGVLGAYILLYPRNRVFTLFWFIVLFRIIPIPAFIFIGFWFLQQIWLAPAGGQIAWYAHIGGFIAGMVLTPFFLAKKSWRW